MVLPDKNRSCILIAFDFLSRLLKVKVVFVAHIGNLWIHRIFELRRERERGRDGDVVKEEEQGTGQGVVGWDECSSFGSLMKDTWVERIKILG
ncbi:hypothetical protein RUM44_012484 [Polyplax serrata]|uniref:Uncharacterized protein n=1 Tax=Polyplax serrata TaxID=468196 RepID=A0ABR1BFC0_POLSC